MTSRTLATLALVAAGAFALAGCAHPARGTTGNPANPGTAGFGAIDSPSPSDATPSTGTLDDTANGTGNGTGSGTGNGTGGGTGTGTGGGHHASPSPSTAPSGPRIISFSASGATCGVDPKPDAPYGQPSSVTVSWKVGGGATGVSLYIDGGLWSNYSGTEGSATPPFSCDNSKQQTVTHTYKLVTSGGGASVSKTTSTSAQSGL
jgi:hypothetical protein